MENKNSKSSLEYKVDMGRTDATDYHSSGRLITATDLCRSIIGINE